MRSQLEFYLRDSCRCSRGSFSHLYMLKLRIVAKSQRIDGQRSQTIKNIDVLVEGPEDSLLGV